MFYVFIYFIYLFFYPRKQNLLVVDDLLFVVSLPPQPFSSSKNVSNVISNSVRL